MDTLQGKQLCQKILPPFKKGSALKEKNLLPLGANSFLLEQTKGSKFFSFRADPFLKGFWREGKTGIDKSFLPCE